MKMKKMTNERYYMEDDVWGDYSSTMRGIKRLIEITADKGKEEVSPESVHERLISEVLSELTKLKSQIESMRKVFRDDASIEDIVKVFPDYPKLVQETYILMGKAESLISRDFPLMERIDDIIKRLSVKDASTKFGL